MMPLLLLLLPVALAADPGPASPEARSEPPGLLSLSLQEALASFRASSEVLAMADADLARAEADRAAAFGGYLPTLGAAVSYNHTFKSEYDGLFDSAGGATGATGATGGTTGTGTGGAAFSNPFEDLPFGADDTWRVDLSLTQTVYGGGAVRAQNRLAEASRDIARLGLRSTEAAATLDVATAYLDAVLADAVLGIARAALAQAETTLDHATAAARVGRQPEFEVLRARVEVENQRVVVIQQERWAELAGLRLKQLLGIPADQALVLTTDLDEAAPSVGEPAEGDRIAALQARFGLSVAESALRLTRAAGLPQVGLSAAGGVVAYPDDPLPPTEDWRTNLSAGASVSMPLFAGGTIRARIRGARADLDRARAQAELVAELAALDTQDANGALAAARARWEATAGTIEQAEKAYAIGEVRFREGISTQAELADARLLLQRAQANRAQAGRDLQLAALRVQLLHELPLSSR